MERDGKRWKQIEIDGNRWKQMEIDSEDKKINKGVITRQIDG